MILFFAILTSVLLIAVMMRFLLKDFFKFIVKKTSLGSLPKGFIDLGEYFATWFFVILIALFGFAFYKFETALASYVLSDDLTSFFVILRGVFTVKTELQNPFIIQHMIAGFILTPAFQFVACYMIYKSIKSFMLFINRKYGNHTYNESDLIYFSFIAVLVFVIVAVLYCKPTLQGQVLQQNDITQWKAMAQNSFEFKSV